MLGHLLRVAQVVGDGQRLIKRPVDADRLQQRMRAIGGEAFAREFAVAVFVAVDDAVPAWKRPGRRAEMNLRRQSAASASSSGEGGAARTSRARRFLGGSADRRRALGAPVFGVARCCCRMASPLRLPARVMRLAGARLTSTASGCACSTASARAARAFGSSSSVRPRFSPLCERLASRAQPSAAAGADAARSTGIPNRSNCAASPPRRPVRQPQRLPISFVPLWSIDIRPAVQSCAASGRRSEPRRNRHHSGLSYM